MPALKFKPLRTERSKREELATYRELNLRRDLKSAAQRRRVEANGLRRVLGDGSGTQPFLIVETRRYRALRLEVQRRLLLEARAIGLTLSVDVLLRQLKPRVEALTYAQLAEDDLQSARHVTVAALGRPLTPQEQACFSDARAATAEVSAWKNQNARLALNHVLGSIEKRQKHNPARYRTIWTQVVGSDAAQQSELDRVDPQTQIAWFRCHNSVLASDLQRRRGLAAKLAAALGVPVRQLRSRF